MFKKFLNLFKKNNGYQNVLLNGEKDLEKCDSCENMLSKLKKCETCRQRRLCNYCLKTKLLCNSCNIEYQKFCKSLERLKNL